MFFYFYKKMAIIESCEEIVFVNIWCESSPIIIIDIIKLKAKK